jgi:hypothetical protein
VGPEPASNHATGARRTHATGKSFTSQWSAVTARGSRGHPRPSTVTKARWPPPRASADTESHSLVMGPCQPPRTGSSSAHRFASHPRGRPGIESAAVTDRHASNQGSTRGVPAGGVGSGSACRSQSTGRVPTSPSRCRTTSSASLFCGNALGAPDTGRRAAAASRRRRVVVCADANRSGRTPHPQADRTRDFHQERSSPRPLLQPPDLAPSPLLVETTGHVPAAPVVRSGAWRVASNRVGAIRDLDQQDGCSAQRFALPWCCRANTHTSPTYPSTG